MNVVDEELNGAAHGNAKLPQEKRAGNAPIHDDLRQLELGSHFPPSTVADIVRPVSLQMMAGCSYAKANLHQRLSNRVAQFRVETAQPNRLIVVVISSTMYRNGDVTSLNKQEPSWLIKMARRDV